MDSYKILWKRSAEKDLRSINKQHIPRLIEAVESLSDNPFPVQHRKLFGTNSSYRIRIGDYRVVYQIDSEKKLITVYHIRHRKDIYRKGR
jgi:mRNA interferase RelE/StbE